MMYMWKIREILRNKQDTKMAVEAKSETSWTLLQIMVILVLFD